jgi:hypothetical protein
MTQCLIGASLKVIDGQHEASGDFQEWDIVADEAEVVSIDAEYLVAREDARAKCEARDIFGAQAPGISMRRRVRSVVNEDGHQGAPTPRDMR